MALRVLQTRRQIDQARRELERRGLSFLAPPARGRTLLDRLLGRKAAVAVGDHLKSWDVLETTEFLLQNMGRDARILDIGAFNSEVLPILHRAGFSQLKGIDLNPEVRRMPYADRIQYTVGDLRYAPFAGASFDAVTAISVIEHGFDGAALLAELARLLAPGGVFLCSFDYWPEKIDTTGTLFFGMSWRIFSQPEVEALLDGARAFGLAPIGSLDFRAAERPIHCAERDYTFGWMALRRT